MDNILSLKNTSPDNRREFESILVLRKCSTRTARNGSPFLVVEFGDKHGSFITTCFSDSEFYPVLNNATEGTIFHLKGFTDYYQDRLSPRLTFAVSVPIELAAEKGWLEDLVELPTEPIDSLKQSLHQFVNAIEHEKLRETVKLALADLGEAFSLSSAAISMHHAYQAGLLEHTTRMARAAAALLPLYPEVCPSLAMSGIILHDVGKVLEYETKLTTRKTRLGVLQGHVVLGYRLVRKAALQTGLDADLSERLEHIILSHQGELEWGAAVMAATPEAVFVSMIDNLDARMGMVQHALRHKTEQAEFSEYLMGLKSPLLLTSPSTH